MQKLTEAVQAIAEAAGVSGAEIDAVREIAAESVRTEAARVRAKKLEGLGSR